jgi:HD-GYP domain-containing protein (c-di-GMP phosphodiesterase class II)
LAGVLFLLVPMMVVRHALQAAAEMDAAYEATLRGLVTAIEAKDAYTRGHAERVSKLTTLIARELGFSEKAVHSIRIAALMHDVGKLVVSTAILTKPGKLTDEEYEHMKWHPIFGCEVIEEIDFLRDGEAVNAVRHHHERLDGRGYPDNLFGDDVPLTARVVMVADAFDSMTSTRTYRFAKSVDDGLRELRRCAATQFDPLCISALDRAIHKHGWEPTPELYGGEQTERPAVSVHAEHA